MFLRPHHCVSKSVENICLARLSSRDVRFLGFGSLQFDSIEVSIWHITSVHPGIWGRSVPGTWAASTNRPVIYVSEQGKFGFVSFFFRSCIPNYGYTALISTVSSIFTSLDCWQFSMCLSCKQLDSIHILISAQAVDSSSGKCLTSHIPLVHLES